MTDAHAIRGRLHSARMHLTFVERELAKSGTAPEVVQAVVTTADDLRELERLVVALLGTLS